MTKEPTEKYGRLAEECRQKAEAASLAVDRQAWLKLAEDWDKLARGADLRQMWRLSLDPPPAKRPPEGDLSVT
jgi:hypothetical protein